MYRTTQLAVSALALACLAVSGASAATIEVDADREATLAAVPAGEHTFDFSTRRGARVTVMGPRTAFVVNVPKDTHRTANVTLPDGVFTITSELLGRPTFSDTLNVGAQVPVIPPPALPADTIAPKAAIRSFPCGQMNLATCATSRRPKDITISGTVSDLAGGPVKAVRVQAGSNDTCVSWTMASPTSCSADPRAWKSVPVVKGRWSVRLPTGRATVFADAITGWVSVSAIDPAGNEQLVPTVKRYRGTAATS